MPRVRGLTDRQHQALAFVASFSTRHGYQPTLREIGDHMGIKSTNGVNDHLKALERKGYIARPEMKSRATTITPKGVEHLAQKAEPT